MQEVLAYLRANDFECFIVSGGGADFMRVWSERVYGIPPQNVVGSMGQAKYELRDGEPTLIKTLDHLFVDDKEGKPVGIHQFIGRRPIACFGNSNGDQAMLEYTTIKNPHPSFGLIVHHTDADREYAYDANPTSSGKLSTQSTAIPAGRTVEAKYVGSRNRHHFDLGSRSASECGRLLTPHLGRRQRTRQSNRIANGDAAVSGFPTRVRSPRQPVRAFPGRFEPRIICTQYFRRIPFLCPATPMSSSP